MVARDPVGRGAVDAGLDLRRIFAAATERLDGRSFAEIRGLEIVDRLGAPACRC